MNLIKGVKRLFYMSTTYRHEMRSRLYVATVEPSDDSKVSITWNSRYGREFTRHAERDTVSLAYFRSMMQNHHPRGEP